MMYNYPRRLNLHFLSDHTKWYKEQLECIPMDPYSTIDLSKIDDTYTLWKRHLPTVQVYYAMKCNPHPFIVKHVCRLGIYVDCASKQEIHTALQYTSADHIIYANPCKFSSHITYAKEQHVTLTVVDCEC